MLPTTAMRCHVSAITHIETEVQITVHPTILVRRVIVILIVIILFFLAFNHPSCSRIEEIEVIYPVSYADDPVL